MLLQHSEANVSKHVASQSPTVVFFSTTCQALPQKNTSNHPGALAVFSPMCISAAFGEMCVQNFTELKRMCFGPTGGKLVSPAALEDQDPQRRNRQEGTGEKRPPSIERRYPLLTATLFLT